MAPDDVITLLLKQNPAVRELDTEATADENQESRTFLALHPLPSLVATWVDAPFDLDVVAPARITVLFEMPEQPSSVQRRILACVTHVHAVVHVPER
ncbi:hypothetical protein SALBM311S_10013 [Streptomyces alboniger]